MPKNRDLNPGQPLPAAQYDALNEFLGTQWSPNFKLTIRPADQTVLEIIAGADNAQVACAVLGRWRYITTPVSRGGTSGAARSLDVYVTASENVFAAPVGEEEGEQDDTDYAFGLAITETGVAPTGVALYRKVGIATWDGTKFTAAGLLTDPVTLKIGTAVGQVASGNAQAFPGAVSSNIDLTARLGDVAKTVLGAVGPGGEAGTKFGLAGDASVYRNAANSLRTPGAWTVDGATTLTGPATAPTPTAGDNSTKIATTAFVAALVASSTPTGVAYLAGTQTFAGANTFTQQVLGSDNVIARNGLATKVNIGAYGGYAGVAFGSAADLAAYRGAAGLLNVEKQLSVADAGIYSGTIKTGPSTTDSFRLHLHQNLAGGANLWMGGNQLGGGNAAQPTIYFGDNSIAGAAIRSTYTFVNANPTGDLIFLTSPDPSTTALTERMRISGAGVVTAPTPAAGDNSQKVATTAFVAVAASGYAPTLFTTTAASGEAAIAQFTIPAGRLTAGLGMAFQSLDTSTLSSNESMKVHLGPLGTTADPVVGQTATTTTGSNNSTHLWGMLQILTAGASGTAAAAVSATLSGSSGTNSVGTNGYAAVAVDTTVQNFLTITSVFGANAARVGRMATLR